MDFPDLDYLKVYHFNTNYKIRLGSKFDGGYVIGLIPGSYDCYISAGVANEESFSRDFINFFKMNKTNSFAFDGTIDQYPYNYTRNITYIKKNINTMINNSNTNLMPFINNYKNIFLKMDIEGGEYPWLLSLNSENLNSFKQIVIEFHGINDNSWNTLYKDKIQCFKKLSQTHYIIHAHGNNHGKLTGKIPNVIELTYIRKNTYDENLSLNRNVLPNKYLDFPCDYLNLTNPEVDLNFSPFVNVD
jgi:hypothetical protein